METITARKNPLMGHIRRLVSERKYRQETGEFVCEGGKLLQEALLHGVDITLLVHTADASLPQGLPQGLRQVCVPADLLAYIADTKTPQKILFLCRMPQTQAPKALPLGSYLVLEGMQDPGNVGTIWRTADAFGAEGLFLLSGCADPYAPKTVRATMGAVFRLPLWSCTQQDLQALLQDSNIPLYATSLRADSEALGRCSLQHAAVVIGSEGKGISDGLLAICDRALLIPMRPRCESLNAAVAASVILWEMART